MSTVLIQKHINSAIYGGNYRKLKKKAGTRFHVNEIRIKPLPTARAFKNSVNTISSNLVKQAFKPANKTNIWENSVNNVLSGLSMGPLPTMGRAAKKGGGTKPRVLDRGRLFVEQEGSIWILTLFAAEKDQGFVHQDDLIRYIRTAIYDHWIITNNLSNADQLAQKIRQYKIGKKSGKPYQPTEKSQLMKTIGQKTEFAHDERSTVGVVGIIDAIEEELDDPSKYPGLSYDIVKYNLIDIIIDILEIDYRETRKYNPQTGKFEMVRVVTGELKENQKVGLKTDIRKLMSKAGKATVDQILKAVKDDLEDAQLMHPEKAAEFAGSPSFKKQAAQAAKYKLTKDILNKNKKRVTKKPKLKKPSTKPRSVSAKKAKKPKSGALTKRSIKPVTSTKSSGSEKGGGRQANTQKSSELIRLKKYIQGRLPAEVRRNMGRPALINRTGRFSNSVELLSLTQSKNTIMAKYTYLLSPYETFENTGKRKWPLAYNPKPLIAKSIRNLAQGRIEQKLTVRRV